MTIAPHAPPRGVPHGSPQEVPYDARVAKTEMVGIEKARQTLGPLLERADAEHIHFPLTRHGQPKGVLVDMEWYRRMRALDGDPTDL